MPKKILLNSYTLSLKPEHQFVGVQLVPTFHNFKLRPKALINPFFVIKHGRLHI